MSGGEFDYIQYRIEDTADKIRRLAQRNSDLHPDTLARFEEAAKACETAAKMVQRVDWLVSDDDGEDSFHRRWETEVLGNQCDAITTLRARIADLEADRAQWASIPTMPIGKLFGWDEPTWRNVAKWAGNEWTDFMGPDHVEKRLLLRQRWLNAGGSMDGVTLPPAPPA